jgi:hypothetical protein
MSNSKSKRVTAPCAVCVVRPSGRDVVRDECVQGHELVHGRDLVRLDDDTRYRELNRYRRFVRHQLHVLSKWAYIERVRLNGTRRLTMRVSS